MDPNQSTGLPTGTDPVVNPQQVPAQQTVPVNPAQTPLPTTNPQDYSGVVASYEQRISRLMSEKDKALNERNQAIAQLSELQKQYTDEQSSTHQSLNNTAQAAQTAINQSRLYEAQIKSLQGELLRSKTLLAKPHLAAYEQFIPASENAEEMNKLVEQLEAIRNQDMERSRAQQPYGNVPSLPGLPSSQQQQQLPSAFPGQSQATNPLNLYANRPNMAPGLNPPGSNPAMMNPAGAGNPTDAIQQMLYEALNSGDQNKYQTALEQAKTLANAAVQQQMGGR